MGHTHQPIFITGSVRTGTSILTRALVDGAGIPGYAEGCITDIFGSFVRMVDIKYARRSREIAQGSIMLERIDQEKLKKSLAQWFKELYDARIPFRGMWVDKTPDNDTVLALPYLLQAWPDATCIIMKRRPIENIASRLRKFPHLSFEQHCIALRDVLVNMQRACERLPKDRYLVLDQYDIATKPQQTAKAIGIFLNLSIPQIEKMATIFEHRRPEFTGGDEQLLRSLEEMPWTPEQKTFFLDTFAELMPAFGWGLETTYYLEGTR
ncbi:MAG: hypothetical protein RL150_443 [Candidatus Parcubacteria bacterium]|jgi:hypothetical protein